MTKAQVESRPGGGCRLDSRDLKTIVVGAAFSDSGKSLCANIAVRDACRSAGRRICRALGIVDAIGRILRRERPLSTAWSVGRSAAARVSDGRYGTIEVVCIREGLRLARGFWLQDGFGRNSGAGPRIPANPGCSRPRKGYRALVRFPFTGTNFWMRLPSSTSPV